MVSLIQIFLCLLLVACATKPLGLYMADVYEGGAVFLSKPLGWLERLIYKACGIDPKEEMTWRSYAMAILALGAAGFVVLFAILLFQGSLPLNPQGHSGLSPDLAFNAAIAFLIVAFVLFLVIKAMNTARRKEAAAPPPPPPPAISAEEKLLGEIRDLLRARA